jgi:hypothetical protein
MTIRRQRRPRTLCVVATPGNPLPPRLWYGCSGQDLVEPEPAREGQGPRRPAVLSRSKVTAVEAALSVCLGTQG